MWSPGSVGSRVLPGLGPVRSLGDAADPVLGHDRPGRRVDVPLERSRRRDVHPGVERVDEPDLRSPALAGWFSTSSRVTDPVRHREHVRGLGHEHLAQAQLGAGRAGARDDGVLGRVGGVLHREEERLAVALAGVRAGAHVLPDDSFERRVELVPADLEREAEAAGRVVAPVLRRAGRVIEGVRGFVGVAVLRRHAGPEVVVDALVRRRALRAEPGGRSTRLLNVWLVIRVVTCRVDTRLRMFCVSGSENGPAPR